MARAIGAIPWGFSEDPVSSPLGGQSEVSLAWARGLAQRHPAWSSESTRSPDVSLTSAGPRRTQPPSAVTRWVRGNKGRWSREPGRKRARWRWRERGRGARSHPSQPAGCLSAHPGTLCSPGAWNARHTSVGLASLLRRVGLKSGKPFEKHLDLVIMLSKLLGKDCRRRTSPKEQQHKEMVARCRCN